MEYNNKLVFIKWADSSSYIVGNVSYGTDVYLVGLGSGCVMLDYE